MSEHISYRLGPDVPEDEDLRDSHDNIVDDSHDNIVDESYVERAVEEAVEEVRGRGRPSLSQSGESPLMRVRLPRELDEAISAAARDAGASRSEWVRHALDEAVHRAG